MSLRWWFTGNKQPMGFFVETILLVEDNLAIREAAAHILRESGYSVLEAGDGKEAMGVAQKARKPIDLLLADIAMPGMSGRELAQQLRRGRPHLGILHMTGFEAADGEVAGEDPVIPFRKPFTGAVLLQKVREILDIQSSKSRKRLRKREKP